MKRIISSGSPIPIILYDPPNYANITAAYNQRAKVNSPKQGF